MAPMKHRMTRGELKKKEELDHLLLMEEVRWEWSWGLGEGGGGFWGERGQAGGLRRANPIGYYLPCVACMRSIHTLINSNLRPTLPPQQH